MKYVEPQIEILSLEATDIISTSGFASGFEDDDDLIFPKGRPGSNS